MPGQPVPVLFQLYFYSAVITTVVFSLIVLALYRRAVLRYMLAVETGTSPAVELPAPARLPREEVASDVYDAVARRLKRRLALIYACVLAAIVLLAVWIRFFRGEVMLISGSIVFTMWRALMGPVVAWLTTAMLYAAVVVPLIAVLLAWSWRKALVILGAYLLGWAFLTHLAAAIAKGRAGFDLAGLMVPAQLFLASNLGWWPLLLLLVTGNRRVRAVAPITFAGALTVLAVVMVALWAVAVAAVKGVISMATARVLGHSGLIVLVALVPAVFAGWLFVRLLAGIYERKGYSDRQLLVDCWALLITLFTYARLGESPETPQLLIVLGFIVFGAYRVAVAIALRLFIRPVSRPPSRRLLLLRTFGFQARTERLFDDIAQRWRFDGSVLMIAGADLASRLIDPGDYLRFLSRRMHEQFVHSRDELSLQLEQLDETPDPDGRYRTNELYCTDNIWQEAVVALIDRADVVLMDLRGFSAARRGVMFELEQLARRMPMNRIVLVADDTTDRELLRTALGHQAVPTVTLGGRWRRGSGRVFDMLRNPCC